MCSAGAERWGGDPADGHGAIIVAKRKDAIALFEVITNRRSEVNLDVPKWMGGQGSAGVQEAPAEQGDSQPDSPESEPSPLGAEQAEPEAGHSPPPAEPAGAIAPFTVRVTQRHLIYAGAGLLLALLLAAWIGYALGGGSSQEPNPDATGGSLKQKTPVGSHVTARKGGASKAGVGASKGLPTGAASRVKGKYYLIVQRLGGSARKDKAEADRIAGWLAGQGEPATVELFEMGGKKYYIVWSLRGFDRPTDDDAQQFGKRIEGLGKKYFSEYKTYNFLQRNKGKYDPWYIRKS